MPTTLLCTVALLAAPETNEWAEFLGFTADGRFAAYRKDVDTRRDDGTHDQYSVIQTIDLVTGKPVARFKATAIHRLDPTGKPMNVKEEELGAANPWFRDAYPNKSWKKLTKRTAVASTKLDLGSGAVELHLDDDVSATEDPQKDALYFAAAAGQPLGFGAIVDAPPHPMVLAHRRVEPTAKAMTVARVQAFAAKNGKAVALVTIFLVNDGKTARTTTHVDVLALDNPIETRHVVARAEQPKPFDPWTARAGLETDPTFRREANAAGKNVDPRERKAMQKLYGAMLGL
jgi:hypothetical protein